MAEKRVHYGKLAGLKDVYLEDSFVLGISQDDASLRFTMLFVLRESHPDYVPPARRERYCFRLGMLELRGMQRCSWARRTMLKYRDADGRVDYGNIDVFYREGDAYHLEGDWGVVDLVASPPLMTLTQ